MTTSSDKSKNHRILSPAIIKDYLQANPTFFDDNPDILKLISLPHKNGGAISLIERQIALLRKRDLELSNHISGLLSRAQDNEQLFKKTSRLIVSLISAANLTAVIDALSKSLSTDFQVEFHQLVLFDERGLTPTPHARIIAMKEAKLQVGSLLEKKAPLSGILTNNELHFLFEGKSKEIQSTAVATLSDGSVFGILAIGSSDSNYYNNAIDTLFFNQIAEVLSQLIPVMLNKP
ncbi:MAG: hypothetical protein ACI9LL_000704 [Porticoccus sp.]|jgi:uncharacterized protein YigA (DUF484 family)